VNISEAIKSIDSSTFQGVELSPKNGVEDENLKKFEKKIEHLDTSTISNNRDLELIPQSTQDSQVNTSTYPRTPLAGSPLDDSSSQALYISRYIYIQAHPKHTLTKVHYTTYG